MSTNLKRFTLLLSVVGTFILFGSVASAMCAYNDTDTTIRVEFDCGVFCYNE